ncbi:MAG: insulinase family protein [Verrucomicrobiales bacterium]
MIRKRLPVMRCLPHVSKCILMGSPVMGHLENFNQINRSNLYSYYRERYAPNNMFLVCVGDFDSAEMRERIETFFSDHPRRSVAPVFCSRRTYPSWKA